MKFKPGVIVFAGLPGQKVWWPGQIANPAEASDEAYYRQVPGHYLVCFYGHNKWAWLPAQRVVEYEAGLAEFARKRSPSPVWQLAWEEAKEAFDRSKGRPVSGKHNPPAQLQVKPSSQPAAGAEVLFGSQQHPRALPLMVALQKGITQNSNNNHTTSNNSNSLSREPSRKLSDSGTLGLAGNSSAPASQHTPAPDEQPRSVKESSSKVGCHIPAWPEYLHECAATEADVRATSAKDALLWLRSLAKGCPPPVSLTPEQEISARQQLTSYDLARRATAFNDTMAAADAQQADAMAGVVSSSPRLVTRRSAKPSGLQSGTHSLSLPEEVAKALAPVQQYISQEVVLSLPAAPASDPKSPQDSNTPPRRGGGTVMSSAPVDIVLRVNGQLLPYTCAATVQVVAVNGAANPPAGAAPASVQVASSTSAGPIVLQYRVVGLHVVLQQLFAVPASAAAATSGPAAENGPVNGKHPAGNENAKNGEKQPMPGPVVEGWKAVGPHQVMLSLTVPESLLQVVAAGRMPLQARVSNSGSEPTPAQMHSPRMLSSSQVSATAQLPARSPSAALLTCYGYTLTSSGPGKRQGASHSRPPCGSAVLKRPSTEQLAPSGSDASTSCQSMLGAGSYKAALGGPPHKRSKTDGDGAPRNGFHNANNPASAALARHRSAATPQSQQAPKRPHWSSRVTPYDPADPFWHPMVSQGCKYSFSKHQATPHPTSPTAEGGMQDPFARPPSYRDVDGAVGTMGPPQPRTQSGAKQFQRRSTDHLYLGSLQPVHTGWHRHDTHHSDHSPMAEDASARLAAALQVLEPAGTPETLADPAEQGSKQPGVLLVEFAVGDVSKFQQAAPSSTQPQPASTREQPLQQSGKGWQKQRLEKGVAQLMQVLSTRQHSRGGKGSRAGSANLLALPSLHRTSTFGMSPPQPHAIQDPKARSSSQLPRLPSPPLQAGSPAYTTTSQDLGATFRRPSWPAAPNLSASQIATAEGPSVTAAPGPMPGAGLPLRQSKSQVVSSHQLHVDGLTARPNDAILTNPSVPQPGTPQLDSPYGRSQTPEGQQLQAVAAQLARAADSVRGLLSDKHPATLSPIHPSAMEALMALRDKAAAVATRVMVSSLSPAALANGDSQLRSEPLQCLLCAARDTLAACDAAAATHITSHALHATTAPCGTPGLLSPASAAAVSGSLIAYAGVAAASAKLLMLLGGSGDEEEEEESDSEEEEEEQDEQPTEKPPRRLGLLGGLEQEEIEALQAVAQPLAAVVPAAVSTLHSVSAAPPRTAIPVATPVLAASPAAAPHNAAAPKPVNGVIHKQPEPAKDPPVANGSHDAHAMLSTCAGSAEAACASRSQPAVQSSATKASVCVASPA